MHHLTKKAAVEKYSATPKEELEAALKADSKEFTPEEIAEITEAINGPSQAPPQQQPPVDKKNEDVAPKKKGNASIDMSNYNPNDLKSPEKWAEYQKMIAGLFINDQYDFEKYKAKPVRKPRYEGVPGTPIDMMGLELVSTTPVHSSRIPVSVANDHNGQIENAHSIAGHGTYYLLKKVS